MPSCVPVDWMCFSAVCLGTVKGDTKQKCYLSAFAAWYPLFLWLIPQLTAHTICSWSYIFLRAALPSVLEVPISVAVPSAAAAVCAATSLDMLSTRVYLRTPYLRSIVEIVSEILQSANASRTARRKSGPSYSFLLQNWITKAIGADSFFGWYRRKRRNKAQNVVEIITVVAAQHENFLLAHEAHLIIRFGACYYRLTAIHGHRGDRAILQQQVLRERCVHYARFPHNTSVPRIPSPKIRIVDYWGEALF